jgi:hypothetical protein
MALTETSHFIYVLKETQTALKEKNSIKLKSLSNKTIHTAASFQDPGSLTIAVIIYSLSKLIERQDYKKIRTWNVFEKKFNLYVNKAISELEKNKFDKYQSTILKIRKTISSISPNLKHYIKDVLKKASINKGSKLYEHGISLGQTAQLLGISEWELSEYAAQKSLGEEKYNLTINVRQRAKSAMEFFT